MTNMTNDGVIFREGEYWISFEINSHLYIIYILYINVNKTEGYQEYCWSKADGVICHFCHFWNFSLEVCRIMLIFA